LSPAPAPPHAPSPSPLQAAICLIGQGIENIDGGLSRLGGSIHRVLAARSEMVIILIAQMSDLLAPISKSTTHT
jgi:hypothetical protein